MIKLSTNVLGVHALKNGRIIQRMPFPQEPKEIAKRLAESETGVCGEEVALLNELVKTGIKELDVDNPNRFHGRGFGIEFIEDKSFVDPLKIADELGIPRKEVQDMILAVNRELTKQKLRVLERDQIMIQAVSSLDDIEEVSNRLMERLREWYSLHFPELSLLVVNSGLYARIIASKDKVSMDGGLEAQIEAARKDSLGMDYSDSDMAEVRRLAESVVKLDSFREDTEKYIEEMMREIAPNTCELAGPLLGARLIAIAGSLERLSKLPGSTIQIMGAEESFFRFLKTRKLPPKHGVIFQLPEIRSAPKHLRGKFSRKFASKMAIASKADYFKGEFIGDKLRSDFLEAVEKLKKQPAKKTFPEDGGGRPRHERGLNDRVERHGGKNKRFKPGRRH